VSEFVVKLKLIDGNGEVLECGPSDDLFKAAWFGNFIAYTGLLPAASSLAHGLKKGTNLVLESSEAYSRTIYHLHLDRPGLQ
jgi:hypothetical protein